MEDTRRKRKSSSMSDRDDSWCVPQASGATGVSRELADCLMAGMTRLWQSEALFDYTLKAEGQSFPVHRAVLASVSDYFYAMLTNGMKESQQDFVDLKGISGSMLKLLIQFIYTGHLPVTEDNVIDLLLAASHLQMTTAVKLCLSFMSDSITIENCVDLLDISRLHSTEKEFAKMEDFMAQHFEKVVEGEHHLKMSFDSLRGLVSREELLYGPEYKVFLAVEAWVCHDLEGRSKHLNDLMRHIRFPLMTREEIDTVKTRHSVLMADPVCRNLLEEAERYLQAPTHRRAIMQTKQTELRARPSILAIQDEAYSYWFGLQPHKNMWIDIKGAIFAETHSAECVVVNDFLVICGGMVVSTDPQSLDDEVTGNCYIFDPREYKWTQIASMNTPRQDFALVAHKDYLFALAGTMVDEVSVTDKIERYSFEMNIWEKFAKMYPTWGPSYCVSGCVFGNCIYVCDGSPDDLVEGSTPNKMACLDIETKSWQMAPLKLEEKCGFPMWTHGNKIYTVENDTAIVSTPTITWYEPHTGECGSVWCQEVLSKAKVVVIDNRVFFLHGCLMDAQDNYWTDLCTEVVIDPQSLVASVHKLDQFPDKETTQYCVLIRLPHHQQC